ncbi:hypothetical protein [Rhizobium sp. GR12]|uniref:hypothetical protein n=1 Tax=Rhizobium sp. GR12 TaxID=3053925 RepID=UPI002FBD34B0
MFKSYILEIFSTRSIFSPAARVETAEPNDHGLDFFRPRRRAKIQQSLSTVNHKNPIVKAILKLASPVWSPVCPRHFIGLPFIRPPRKCFGDFRSGIGPNSPGEEE